MDYKPRYRVTIDLTLTTSHKYALAFLHSLIERKLTDGGVEIAGFTIVDIASLNTLKQDAAASASAGERGAPHTKTKAAGQ